MKQKLYVSSSPHLRSGETTQKIMLDVIIALMPAAIASVIIFGFRSIIVMAVTIASCVISEYISRKIMKRENTISDLSAIVTGLLLAFNLPVNINLLIAAFGGVVAIVVVKQMFGGIGQNFVNPALTARIVLMLSFPTAMTTWTMPFSVDAVTTATPLAIKETSNSFLSYFNLFLGIHGGCLGETCTLALILGGIYLIFRKIIKPIIPLSYIGTVVFIAIMAGENPIYHLLSGGLLLGAIFMATDYTTSPLCFAGKLVFGIGCGIFTMIIRLFGSLPEGVSFSIIIMNILVPHIEKLFIPKAYGENFISQKERDA